MGKPVAKRTVIAYARSKAPKLQTDSDSKLSFRETKRRSIISGLRMLKVIASLVCALFALPSLQWGPEHELDHLELFAGQCAVTRGEFEEGRTNSVAMDYDHDPKTMDLLSDQGFLSALYHATCVRPGGKEEISELASYKPYFRRNADEVWPCYVQTADCPPEGQSSKGSEPDQGLDGQICPEAKLQRSKKNQKADSKTKAKSAKEVMKTAKKDKKRSNAEKTKKTKENKIVDKKKSVGQGISKKRKPDSKPQELKAAEVTPPARRVSFKSPPSAETREEGPTTPPCRPPLIASDQESGFSSPAFSIETLSAWKGEAAKRGLSLESYMEELSAAALEATLEEHMGKLVVESQETKKPEGAPAQPETASVTPARACKNDDNDDSDSSEDSSSESSMDSSEGSGGKDAGKGDDTEDEEGSDADMESDIDMEKFEKSLDQLVGDEPAKDQNKFENKENKRAEKEAEKEDEKNTSPKSILKQPEVKQQALAVTVEEQRERVAAEFAQANSLASHYMKDKTDLFRVWLQHGGDWSKREREGMKPREILQRYSKEKAESLMKNLLDRGLWYWDDDFPRERYFLVGKGDKVRNDNLTKEATAVAIKQTQCAEVAEALANGPLAAGMHAAARTANEKGEKDLMECLSLEDGKAEKVKAKKEKAEKTDKVIPKTFDELLASKMDDALKKAAESRRYAISLSSLDYSGDLSSKLMAFSDKMEKCFKSLQDLRSRKVVDETQYAKFLAVIDEKVVWYEKAEAYWAAAKALQNGLNKKPKRAKGKKADKDKNPPEDQASTVLNGTASIDRGNQGPGRANVKDGVPSAALEAFASLGCHGRHAANQAHVWDCKFPLCILPHDSMATDEVKKQVHTLVAKVVAWDLYPSSLGYWIRKNYFGRGSLDDRLLQLSLELKTECRQERIRINFKRFTGSNTGLDHPSKFPEMASTFKAAFLKSALCFFSKKAIQISEEHPSDPTLKLIAVCNFHLYSAFYCMDHCDLIMEQAEADETGKNLEVHLVAWQHLASFFENLGECLFKLRPKHHNVNHMAQDVPRTRLNPRKVQACFNDESFLGYVKRIGVRCHQSNMMERLYQRYLLYLSLR
ncbi:unnamed protein product [Cladocopium goreaui]|uniref:Uncharacterized protein n=1 Tax=Cladocopium goreaui TaxID=2562237 RepID=A0A9P1BYD4_9DINO|nr:unnamed protein product [Cladocopium goreaui]